MILTVKIMSQNSSGCVSLCFSYVSIIYRRCKHSWKFPGDSFGERGTAIHRWNKCTFGSWVLMTSCLNKTYCTCFTLLYRTYWPSKWFPGYWCTAWQFIQHSLSAEFECAWIARSFEQHQYIVWWRPNLSFFDSSVTTDHVRVQWKCKLKPDY